MELRFTACSRRITFKFIPVNQIVPTAEGIIRIFDRCGERAKRMKARMKFLIKIGKDVFLDLVEKEKKQSLFEHTEIDTTAFDGRLLRHY